MIRKIKNWNKLIRFILAWRKEGEAIFKINTNSEKLVITIQNVDWTNYQGKNGLKPRMEIYYKKIY